jgi:hypothetical protein
MDGRTPQGGNRVTSDPAPAIAALLAHLADTEPAMYAAIVADDDAEGLRLLDLLGATEFDRLAFLARLRPDAPE